MTDTEAETRYPVREEWLNAGVALWRTRFDALGLELPAKVHISVGFSTIKSQENKNILGVTYARRIGREIHEVFISPVVHDGQTAFITIGHELLHVHDDCANGHKTPFQKPARALGYVKPFSELNPTPGLAEWGREVVTDELLAYPHGGMPGLQIGRRHRKVKPDGAPEPEEERETSGPLAQANRWFSGHCTELASLEDDGECGYLLRTSRLHLKRAVPMCPIHGVPLTYKPGLLESLAEEED